MNSDESGGAFLQHALLYSRRADKATDKLDDHEIGQLLRR